MCVCVCVYIRIYIHPHIHICRRAIAKVQPEKAISNFLAVALMNIHIQLLQQYFFLFFYLLISHLPIEIAIGQLLHTPQVRAYWEIKKYSRYIYKMLITLELEILTSIKDSLVVGKLEKSNVATIYIARGNFTTLMYYEFC